MAYNHPIVIRLQRFLRILLGLGLAALAGCAAPRSEPVEGIEVPALLADAPATLPATQSTQPATGALKHVTEAQWNADPQRMWEDVLRAIERMHWGMLRMTSEPTIPPGKNPRPTIQWVAATALLPDGRVARIYARRVSDEEVAVAVRVGEFGHVSLERKYIATLAQVFRDKPRPIRGGTFELPRE